MNRKRNTRILARRMGEIAIAVPQVVAHRAARMAVASPTAHDRRELGLMMSEKSAAFLEAWTAMSLQGYRVSLAWTAAFLRSPFVPLTSAKVGAAGLSILNAGLVPVHRRAVANATRLSRRAVS
jgi:hypothetical protein